MSDPRLFYVIGASGVGKDSLIDYVRQQLPAGAPVAFAHRYITRPADAGGENHVALSDDEFLVRQHSGAFSMVWESHGLRYGIGTEVRQWLDLGLDVVVNGSRDYLAKAAARFPCLMPALIQVDPAVLRTRLKLRGRESAADIEQRLQRAAMLDATLQGHELIRIDNSGPLAQAGQQLLQLLLLPHRDTQ